jgi:hypothetical protein
VSGPYWPGSQLGNRAWAATSPQAKRRTIFSLASGKGLCIICFITFVILQDVLLRNSCGNLYLMKLTEISGGIGEQQCHGPNLDNL